jgi:hypothetical protein
MDKKKEAELIEIMKGDLPIIRIGKTWDEMFTHMELEMEDDTRAMLVRWGKEVATDDEYAEIAVRRGLEEFVERYGESESDEDNN